MSSRRGRGRHAGTAPVRGASRRHHTRHAGRRGQSGLGECIGGLVYVNAIEPGAPAIIGAWPFVSDLRTGAMRAARPSKA